ncbi:HAD family phosphatase [Uliginosibacterium sp. H3]|uniref:HAD family phosphatase n=1 Tax=Uliginosibacterium silvisoli TaxID=3114758 RepID=A0ABU6K7V0_9RHOO|nr:HAD family phosphatase [Uliginosibacterium sp. H3]
MFPAAFLVDLDGTLADSEPLKGLALARTCGMYGGEVSVEVYAEVMGEDWPTVTRHIFRQAGITPDVDAFNEDFRATYLQLLSSEVELTAGAQLFLDAARASAIRLALVSSAMPWMVSAVLSKLDLLGVFDLVITQADVSRHKPDPEAYLLALKRLALPASDVVVIEDSQAGLRAAAGAGCRSIAIRHAFNARHDLSLATRTVTDFHALLSGDVVRPGFAGFMPLPG